VRPKYLIGGLLLIGVAVYFVRNRSSERPPLDATFDGQSGSLNRTAVVPTLDTPLPEGRSAIWCGSFQLAWNALKKLADGPVRVAGAAEAAGRLNEARFADADLDAGSYYAAAGLTKDGIIDKIRADMARRFPGVAPPTFPADTGAAAYAYLQTAIRFEWRYNEDDLTFTDAAGPPTRVRAFGIRPHDGSKADQLRHQVRVLFADDARPPQQFALDLSRTSKPDQVIVARLPRPRTLAEAAAEIKRLTAAAKRAEHGDSLGPGDSLLVPAMAWRVTHHFTELEGPSHRISGGQLEGMFIDLAEEDVQFRLDRSGAEMSSAAQTHTVTSQTKKEDGPRHFRLDGPYLISLTRRGADSPYFVMWVDNAELLAH
jgi:hypothetical protein